MCRLCILFLRITTFSKFAHYSTAISLLHHKIIIILMDSRQFYIFSWIIFTYCFLFYCSNYKLFELKSSFSTFKIWSAQTFCYLSNMASRFIFRLIFVFESTFQQLKSFINQCFIDFKSSGCPWTLAHISNLGWLKIRLNSSCLILRFDTASTIYITILLINNFSLIINL